MRDWIPTIKATFLASTALIIACSDSTAPGTRLTGTYSLALLFDGQPSASGAGTIAFAQPDADKEALNVTGSLTATPVVGTFTAFRDGSLSGNVIRFRVDAPNAWQFEGNVSADGRLITGRHTYAGGFAGSWSAQRLGGSPPPPP